MTRAEEPQPIDRIFKRLSGTYMAAWDRALGAAPIVDVKTVWAHELAGFLQHRAAMQAIAWALENLPERCPNAIEFRNLCRLAPAAPALCLPAPAADPARVAAELAKLAPMQQAMSGASGEPKDYKAWARKIIKRHEWGQKISSYPLRCAHEVLGLPMPARQRLSSAAQSEFTDAPEAQFA